MAAGPILSLPGKVTASNALVVVSVAGTSTGGVNAIANLQGIVDSSNRLTVIFV